MKNSLKYRWIFILLFGVAVFAFSLSTFDVHTTRRADCKLRLVKAGNTPQVPMLTALCLETRNPKLGQNLQLDLSIQPLVNAPNTAITIELPENVRLVKGDLAWHGNLGARETHSHRLIIRIDTVPESSTNTGLDEYSNLAAIKANAVSSQPGMTFGKPVFLFLRVAGNGLIETSNQPFVLEPPVN